MKNAKLVLIVIILIASFLRLYRLQDVPPGVNRDEASIGVTAYSLMTTGKDEYGRSFPLSFESFGDWKLPLYIYVTIPFVKIFGLNELAVRLPSALTGIASVAALYYLAHILFASEIVALLSATALALSPWHIHISRVESEAIVAVLFTLLGSLQFFKAIKHKSLGNLIAFAILFGATYYTYHGTHVSSTLLILGLTLIFWKEITRIPRFWMAGVTGIVLVFAILAITLSADRTKLSGISIFGDPTVVHQYIELPRLKYDNPNGIIPRVLYNRVTYSVVTVFQNYLKSYGPEFLFIRGGGNSAHNIKGYGNLHPIEAPLLLSGIVWLVAMRRKKESKFILWWIMIGGVAAAITKDAPHSNRMLTVIPSFAIAIASGIFFLTRFARTKWRMILAVLLVVGYAASMRYYLNRYFVHFPKTEAGSWGYAYKKLTPLLFSAENAKKHIIMTRPETSPYIYLLFYSGYSPASYQKEATRYPISRDGFTDVSGFGQFSFRAIDWNNDLKRSNTLLVADADEVPKELAGKIVATISLPDNSPQFIVLSTDK